MLTNLQINCIKINNKVTALGAQTPFICDLLYLLKRVLIGDVVHKHGTVAVSVINGAQRMEPLLPCGVLEDG